MITYSVIHSFQPSLAGNVITNITHFVKLGKAFKKKWANCWQLVGTYCLKFLDIIKFGTFCSFGTLKHLFPTANSPQGLCNDRPISSICPLDPVVNRSMHFGILALGIWHLFNLCYEKPILGVRPYIQTNRHPR